MTAQEQKKFNELTDKELAELTNGEVKHYIEIETLEAGIPLEDEVAPEPVVEYPVPTETVFKVGQMHFRNRDDAEAVLKMELLDDFQTPGCGYGAKVTFYDRFAPGSYSEPKLEIISAPSREAMKEAAPKLRLQLKDHEEWEKAKKNQETRQKERDSIAESVWDAIQEAAAKINLHKQLAKTFTKYLGVAGGDRETALRFMRLAHPQFQGQNEIEALAIAEQLIAVNSGARPGDE